MIRALSFAALLAWPIVAPADPPAGQIDPTFGDVDNGIPGLQVEAFDLGGWLTDRVAAMAEDAQGRFIVAGGVDAGGSECLGLMRFMPDGQLDTDGFGFDANDVPKGKICHSILLPGDDLGFDMDIEILPDGGFLIGGNASFADTYVCRFQADGSRMETFGNGGCVFLSQLDNGALYHMPAPILMFDGTSILLVTNRYEGMTSVPALSRLSVDSGQIQPIGNAGFVPLLSSEAHAIAWSAALTSDGALILAGEIELELYDRDAFVARFDLQLHQPASGFGDDGLARFSINQVPKVFEVFTAVTLRPDGDIVAAGSVGIPGPYMLAFAAINAETGAASAAFKSGEPKVFDFCAVLAVDCNYLLVDTVVQTGEHIVLAGEAAGALFAARFTSTGSADIGFGHDGTARFALGGEGTTGVVQQDGRIVLAGSVGEGDNRDFGLLRLSNGRIFRDEFDVTAP